MIPYEPIGEHEIVDEEETQRALAAWFRRDLRRAEERFDAGEFAEEVVATVEAVAHALWHPMEHVYVSEPSRRLRDEGWSAWWADFSSRHAALARIVRGAVITRVLDCERVA